MAHVPSDPSNLEGTSESIQPIGARQVPECSCTQLQLRKFHFDRLREPRSLGFLARAESTGDATVAPDQHLVEVPVRLPMLLFAHPGIERRRTRTTNTRDASHG